MVSAFETIIGVLGVSPALGSSDIDVCFFRYRFVFLWSKVERESIFFFKTCKLLHVPKCLILARRRVA